MQNHQSRTKSENDDLFAPPEGDDPELFWTKVVIGWLVLLISPLLQAMTTFLVSLLDLFASGGIVVTLFSAIGVWEEGETLLSDIYTGSYWSEAKRFYSYALLVNLSGIVVLVAVSALSFASRKFRGLWSTLAERAAKLIWITPYWTYRGLAGVAIILPVLAVLATYIYAAVVTFQEMNIVAWVFGAVFALGIVVAAIVAAWVTVLLFLGPSYVFWRYGIAMGLGFCERGGIGRRTFETAYTGWNHLPFGPPD